MTNPAKQKNEKPAKNNREKACKPEIGNIASLTQRNKFEKTEYAGFNLAVFPDVYFPHEDSYLLADCAKQYAFGKVLDLGCGTGICGLCASLNPNVSNITFVDLSKSAIENSRINAKKNHLLAQKNILPQKNPKIQFSFIQSDLFGNLKNQKFDTILFNPPYLPTNKEEKLIGAINSAFDGGKNGRKVIDRFLSQFSSHLLPNGILLYLDSSLTNTEKTVKYLKQHQYFVEKLSTQRFFFEEISVLSVRRI